MENYNLTQYRKVIVISPPSSTGGPHLLHQFVHELRNLGIDAYISYTNNSKEITKEYTKYNIQIENILDEDNIILVIPESHTNYYYKYKKPEKIIWWLSVDNYLGFSEINKFRRLYSYLRHYFKLAMRQKLCLHRNKALHFHQSEYAKLFLSKYNIKSESLSDYLGTSFINSSTNNGIYNNKRKYSICYNPKKGINHILKIKKYFTSEYNFTPLIGLSEIELKNVLEESMIYLDFGHHPGKDRIPREAVMNGCVLVTNRRGAAKNDIDIPIDKIYKLNNINIELIKILCDDVCENFERHHSNFDNYRLEIISEYPNFVKEVKHFCEILKLK